MAPDARLDLDQALRAILSDTQPITAIERVETHSALGRVIAMAVRAPLNLPPFPASAMDGYALRSSEALGDPPYRYRVAGASYAGSPPADAVPPGCCVRIFTGAPLPESLDAVAIQEDVGREGELALVREPVAAGDNVRGTGHDVRAGAELMAPGRQVTVFDLAWLAACGITRLDVYRQPTVGIFSTGNELVEPGQTLRPGQIFDANRRALHALLGRLPVQVTDFGIVADKPEDIRRMLEHADTCCDVVVTSGGVSVGEADWVKQVVSSIGALSLWSLNLKPGKPVAYGRLRKATFFGLPGNPVSTIVTALMLLKPMLQRLCGAEVLEPVAMRALLRGRLSHQPGREEFQRGRLSADASGFAEVSVTGDQSSNRLSSFAQANCLIRIPKESDDIEDGSEVMAIPFWGAV